MALGLNNKNNNDSATYITFSDTNINLMSFIIPLVTSQLFFSYY